MEKAVIITIYKLTQKMASSNRIKDWALKKSRCVIRNGEKTRPLNTKQNRTKNIQSIKSKL